MRVISIKKLKEFWEDPHNPDAESPLRAWYQTVKAADWTCFADVRQIYSTADPVGNKVVFNIGGNKYRLIAVIDYEGHKVFVRYVLDHEEYDKDTWKTDAFGDDWKPRRQDAGKPESKEGKGQATGKRKPSRKQGRRKG